MKKMKKALALIMALVMIFGLVACGGKTDAPAADAPAAGNEAPAAQGDAAAPAAGEPYKVKFSLATLMVVPSLEATQKVEDVVNDYLKNTLGITDYVLELTIVNIADYFTTIPMELAAGTGPDLVMMLDTMPNYVEQGYVIPLDPYMDNELKGTADLIGPIMNSGKLAGSYYMVPRYFGTVLDWKFIYNAEYAEGIDMSGVNGLASLEPVLAQMKAAHPNDYFLVYADQFPTMLAYEMDISTIGTYAATVGDSTQLVSFYETDAFKEAIHMAYDWRNKGYLDPEGSANTLSHDAVVMGGNSKGVIMGHSADAAGIGDMFDKMNTYGADFEAVTIGIGDLYTDTVGVGISYSCGNPAAAADFIDLLYTDEFVWCSLIYGAEGQDYVWNEDRTVCDYPEGLDGNTIPYPLMYSCGIIGNGFQGLPFENTDSGSSGEYGMELMQNAWCPPLYGFTPSTANVATQVAAVSNVVDQYLKVLTFGDVDPDEFYPQFLDALKVAGIDDIIADYQAQADAWLAAG